MSAQYERFLSRTDLARYDFDREEEALRISKLEEASDGNIPAFVFKQRSYGANSHLKRTSTTALTVTNALVRLQEAGGGQSTQILQKFIKGPGEQACITRVCYRCKYPRKPVGYSIANGYCPSELEATSGKAHGDLTQQYCASTDTSVPGGLVVAKRSSGKALEDAAEVAERMLKFSENYFMLKLEWIVVDVLTDKKGKLWCLQVCRSAYSLREYRLRSSRSEWLLSVSLLNGHCPFPNRTVLLDNYS